MARIVNGLREVTTLVLLAAATLISISPSSGQTSRPELAQTNSSALDAAASRLQPENVEQLVSNRDPAAHFAADGKGVLYRLKDGSGTVILYRDLRTGSTVPIITFAVIARELERAVPHPTVLRRPEFREFDYDPTARLLTFSALGRWWALDQNGQLSDRGTQDFGGEATSPDGRFKVIARHYNLFAVDRATRRQVALTTDGTRDRPYGRGIAPLSRILEQRTDDPEMPVSARWSPDSRWIATWRLDTRGVQPMTLVQQSPTGSVQPRSYSYIYPLAGSRVLPSAERLVIDVRDALRRHRAKVVHLRVPTESLLYPADPDMSWVAGRIRSTWTERGYKQMVVYMADPQSGAASVVAREVIKPLVAVTSTSFTPAPILGGELVISERSRWAQLYLVRSKDPDGGASLTHGAWEVLSVDRLASDGQSLLITGVGREHDRSPYFRAQYRLALDGSEPKLLTPEPLDHRTEVSPDGRWILDRMSSPSVPTRTVLRDGTDGHIVAELARADPAALARTGYTAPEPFQGVAADGTTPLFAMIFRPANFDPSKRYPIIDNIYTAPTQTFVPTSFDETVLSTSNSVAQIGAIVVMIDGRGTSRRGQDFRLPAYQNLGEVGLDDHIAIIRQIASRYQYVDLSRVGAFGGSAGGYDAARFILRRPDFIKVAVASSGNHDLRLDKAWWAEASMGDADDATWERNSNIPLAANLKGRLMLIHGEMDDNVSVTESYRLSDALIRAGKDVELVILPNTGHRLDQPFFWHKLRGFLSENLVATPAAADDPPMAGDKHLSRAGR